MTKLEEELSRRLKEITSYSSDVRKGVTMELSRSISVEDVRSILMRITKMAYGGK